MSTGLNPKDLVGAKKAPLTLIPPSAIIAIAEAMGNGADKYGPFNWRDQPIQVRTYVEAALRHLYAYLDGQWAAEDTGIPHLAHAMAGLAILYDATSLGAIDDNRSFGNAAGELRRQDKSVNPGNLVPFRDFNPVPFGITEEDLDRIYSHGELYPCDICDVPEKPSVTYMGMDLSSGQDSTVYDAFDIIEYVDRSWFKTEDWGEEWPLTDVTYRGDWPPDTRVGGLLTCCGQSEHPLDCPQWR